MRVSLFKRMRRLFSRIKRRFSSAIERSELDVAVRFIVEVRRIFALPIFALRIFGLRVIIVERIFDLRFIEPVEVGRILELCVIEPLVAVRDIGFIAIPLEPILVEPILVEPILVEPILDEFILVEPILDEFILGVIVVVVFDEVLV